MKFRRVHLRLASQAQASQIATTLSSRFSIPEESHKPSEEVQVQARYPVSKGQVMVILYSISIRLFIWAIALAILSTIGILGLALASLMGVGYFGIFAWAIVVRNRQRVTAWIRFEGNTITIRTTANFDNTKPKSLQWRGPETFLLKGPGLKVQLYFPTHEEAAQMVSRIRVSFPTMKEIGLVET